MTLVEQLYTALQIAPCRCQMVGGPKWHLRAVTEVAVQCSRCKAIERYDLEHIPELQDGRAALTQNEGAIR